MCQLCINYVSPSLTVIGSFTPYNLFTCISLSLVSDQAEENIKKTEVRQGQEVKTDEERAGSMIDYDLNPYFP